MKELEKSLFARLKELAENDPEKKLFGASRWLKAKDALTLTEHAATAFLRLSLGGTCVALSCTKTVETAVVLLGLRAAGSLVVLTDPRQRAEEIFAAAETEIPVQAVVEQVDRMKFRVTRTNDGTTALIDLFALPPSTGSTIESSAEDSAFIVFTSGSTGKNKAVVLNERNLIANLIDSEPLGNYCDDDLALGALPFHHVFGLVLLAGAVVLGYGVYFPEKTDPEYLLSCIGSQRLTRMNGVPSLYLAMAEKCEKYDLSSLRTGFIGGSPVTPEQFALIEKKLGIRLIPVYGMSECIGVSCASYHDPQKVRSCGIGAFYPMNTGKILLEDGSEAAQMEEGEICVKGPARMLGYYGKPMDPEEMFRTGDLGYVDFDGVLHLTGRKKDIIIRNGNNLSPRRIEQAILAVPGVQAAAVVGIPDEKQGEVPAAMVAAPFASDRQINLDLPKNELPAVYLFRDQLPLTSSGKPDRQRIREVLIACRNG